MLSYIGVLVSFRCAVLDIDVYRGDVVWVSSMCVFSWVQVGPCFSFGWNLDEMCAVFLVIGLGLLYSQWSRGIESKFSEKVKWKKYIYIHMVIELCSVYCITIYAVYIYGREIPRHIFDKMFNFRFLFRYIFFRKCVLKNFKKSRMLIRNSFGFKWTPPSLICWI